MIPGPVANRDTRALRFGATLPDGDFSRIVAGMTLAAGTHVMRWKHDAAYRSTIHARAALNAALDVCELASKAGTMKPAGLPQPLAALTAEARGCL